MGAFVQKSLLDNFTSDIYVFEDSIVLHVEFDWLNI